MKERRSDKIVPLIPLCMVWLTVSVFLLPFCACNRTPVSYTGLRAAIIDQLAEVQSNEDFLVQTSDMLKKKGFETVDIYQGDSVDVSLYLRLPTLGYRLIILRVHSGLLYEEGEVYEGSWLFTSEPCRQDLRHTDERLTRKIARARIDENHPWVYAVGSRFVTESMQGQFDQAVIIAMGCYSFTRQDLAEAFISRGATCYIGWSGLVNLNYTDNATIELLKNLLLEELPLHKAVSQVTATLGPEPDHKTDLLYFPTEIGNKKLHDILSP